MLLLRSGILPKNFVRQISSVLLLRSRRFYASSSSVLWISRAAVGSCQKNDPRKCYARNFSAAPEESTSEGNFSASLVIFDKDGTLICFHSMWTPWALGTAQRIETASGLKSVDIANEVYRLLGFCPVTQKVKPGLLAEATMPEIKGKLVELLVINGMELNEAEEVVNATWEDSDTSSAKTLKPLHNLRNLFETLKSHGVKIAICTADSRAGTEGALKQLGLADIVDIVVCGDDKGAQPKPSPHNALKICKALGIDPKQAFMVGDTLADMGMGRSAKLGKTVAVLSGVASKQELEAHADHIVQDVGHILSLVLNKSRMQSQKAPNKEDSAGFQPSILAGKIPRSPTTIPTRSLWTRSRNKMPEWIRPTHAIVGAGSAGCVLANRLTEDPGNQVLLIEAGRTDPWWQWKIHMPAALMYNLCDDKYNWFYNTAPQNYMNNRVMYWPRGRVWGGSSSLNAMAYVRGHPMDYDRWGQEGAESWSYAACLPYFKKAQRHNMGADLYRGDSGPLRVTQGPCSNPLHLAFMKAGTESGWGGYTSDMNGYKQEGFGPMDMTIWKGLRSSASRAYLWPVLQRRNLFTETRVVVTKILFDGRKAVGLEYWNHRGSLKQIRIDRDIILCGGAINSPQLLQLSGIGDGDHLRKLGVPVVQHLPGVGANLQDHLEIYVQQACIKPITLYNKSSWKFPHNMIRIGLEWLLFKTGDGATSHLESGGFVRSRPQVPHPDVQFHFLPSTVHDHGRKVGDQHAYQVHVGPMRPTSRGYVRIRSPDPKQHPEIQPNYLETEQDRFEMRECVKISRDVFAQKAFDPYRGVELAPGVEVKSDAQLDAFIRAKADSAYHPSCTCKMGAEGDPTAVISGRDMCVYGVENLRVVDASVMPSVVSGNLNAPTIMLAERAADLIRGTRPLDPMPVPIWKPGDPEPKSPPLGI